MFSSAAAEELSILLSDFLNDKSDNVTAIEEVLRPRVNRYCARHAYNLPLDLREDVLQELFLYLLGSWQKGLPASTIAEAGFIFNLLRSALRSVRRRNGLPTKNRLQIDHEIEPDALPDHRDPERSVVEAIFVDEILTTAGPRVGDALWRIYGEDRDPSTVLPAIGLSRFALLRRRQAIAQQSISLRKAA